MTATLKDMSAPSLLGDPDRGVMFYGLSRPTPARFGWLQIAHYDNSKGRNSWTDSMHSANSSTECVCSSIDMVSSAPREADVRQFFSSFNLDVNFSEYQSRGAIRVSTDRNEEKFATVKAIFAAMHDMREFLRGPFIHHNPNDSFSVFLGFRGEESSGEMKEALQHQITAIKGQFLKFGIKTQESNVTAIAPGPAPAGPEDPGYYTHLEATFSPADPNEKRKLRFFLDFLITREMAFRRICPGSVNPFGWPQQIPLQPRPQPN